MKLLSWMIQAISIQVDTLKSVMGKECYQVYEHLSLLPDTRANIRDILKALCEHFEPKTNVIYERYLFNSCKQASNESINNCLARLWKLAATCEYGIVLDEIIRDRIVIGITHNQIWARLLRQAKLIGQNALDICRSSEQANIQLQQMDPTESAHYTKSPQHGGKDQGKGKGGRNRMIRNCTYCGGSHPKGRCPACGKSCSKCQRQNHLAKV